MTTIKDVIDDLDNIRKQMERGEIPFGRFIMLLRNYVASIPSTLLSLKALGFLIPELAKVSKVASKVYLLPLKVVTKSIIPITIKVIPIMYIGVQSYKLLAQGMNALFNAEVADPDPFRAFGNLLKVILVDNPRDFYKWISQDRDNTGYDLMEKWRQYNSTNPPISFSAWLSLPTEYQS